MKGAIRNGVDDYESSKDGIAPQSAMLIEAAVKDDGITININGKYFHKFELRYKLTPRIGAIAWNYGDITIKYGSFLLTAG